MVCQQLHSPEEEKWKCPYPEEWILQGTKKTACWTVYIRSKAIFIKEFSEAGWVRRVGLPSRNFLTYVIDRQDQTSLNRGLRFKGLVYWWR